MKIHFHQWKRLYDIYFSQYEPNFEVNRIYRHCLRCGKWERFHEKWEEKDWQDSNEPKGVENLISEQEAFKKIKEIRKERNSI